MSASPDSEEAQIAAEPEGETPPEESDISWPISGILLAVLFAGWALLELYWGSFSDTVFLEQMGASSGDALREGQWQRLFLAGWLHLNSGHLQGTLGLVLFLSIGLEPVLSAGAVIVICLLGSISGFAYEGWVAPDVHGIGASGGAWALIGAGLSIYLFGKTLGTAGQRQLAIGVCGFAFLWECLFLWDPSASLRGHLAGGISGVVTGALFCGLMRLEAGKTIARVLAIIALCLAPVAANSLWKITQPWNYSQTDDVRTFKVTEFQRTISVRAPASMIENSRSWKDDDGDLHIVVGDPKRNPLVISLIAWPEPASEHTNDVPAKPVAGKSWREPAKIVEVDGKTFVFIDAEDDKTKSVRFPRWVGYLNGLHVDIQASVVSVAGRKWLELGLDAVRAVSVSDAPANSKTE